jgi:hypothetical protein
MSMASMATCCITPTDEWYIHFIKLLDKGHEGSVEAVAFAHSLALTLTAGMDGKLCIWENASLEMRGTCEHPEVCWSRMHGCWAAQQLPSHSAA